MQEKMYSIEYSKPALKFLKKQSPKTQAEIISDINGLPWKGNIIKLQGREKEYRLKTHGFRVIFKTEHDRLIVLVLDIDNRGDVYK